MSGSDRERAAVGEREVTPLAGSGASLLDPVRGGFPGEEAFGRLAQGAARTGYWSWDLTKGDLLYSDDFYRIHGMPIGSLGGRIEDYLAFVHPDDRARIEEKAWSAAAGAIGPTEYRFIHPDGGIRHLSGQSAPLSDGSDQILRLVGTIQDVTEVSVARRALTEAFKKLAAYFDEAPTPAYLWRLEGEELYIRRVNKAALVRFGLEAEQLLNTSASELLADRPDIVADIMECLRTQTTSTRETYLETRGLGERRLVTTYVPLAADTVVGHVEDISELLEVTRRERRASERLTRYFERAPTPAYLWRERDGELVLEGANLAGEQLTRGLINEVVGLRSEEIYSGRPDIVEDLRRAHEGETFTREMPYRMQGSDETLDLVVTYVHVPPDTVVVHTRDVTQQRRMEAELRESHEAARAVLDASNQPILLVDVEGTVLEANEAARMSFGLGRDELLGRPMYDFFPPEVGEGRRRIVEEVARTGRPIVREDRDEDRYYRARLYPISDEAGTVSRVVIYAEDVTEERGAREELLQSRESLRALTQHLESVRERERMQVARDLHDELGSVLTALKIDVEELRSNASCEVMSDRLETMTGLLDQAIEVGRGITARLRPGILDDLGLPAATEWLGQDLERRTGVRCTVTLPEGDPEIPRGLATTMFRILQEALTNVIRHARAESVEISLAVSAEDVSLAVADDGRGFRDVDTGGRSFGLLGMRERVHAFRGTLDVVSAPGTGTTVRVVLPKDADAEVG